MPRSVVAVLSLNLLLAGLQVVPAALLYRDMLSEIVQQRMRRLAAVRTL